MSEMQVKDQAGQAVTDWPRYNPQAIEPKVGQHLEGKEIIKMFYVPGRILNIVAR